MNVTTTAFSRALLRPATSRISSCVVELDRPASDLAMLCLEQCFRPRDLPRQIELIDPTDDTVLLCALPGDGARVLLPERRRSVCVEMAWAGGVPATDTL